MKFKITTKVGDANNGPAMTSLWLGGSVEKYDERIDVIGEIDELSAHIGVLSCEISHSFFNEFIDSKSLQEVLTWVMGEIACVDNKKTQYRKRFSFLSQQQIKVLEEAMEFLMSHHLKDYEMTDWKKYGESGIEAAKIDLVGRVVRRVERRLHRLGQIYEIRNEILNFFNRLSDFFFLLARVYGLKHESQE